MRIIKLGLLVSVWCLVSGAGCRDECVPVELNADWCRADDRRCNVKIEENEICDGDDQNCKVSELNPAGLKSILKICTDNTKNEECGAISSPNAHLDARVNARVKGFCVKKDVPKGAKIQSVGGPQRKGEERELKE